MVEQNRAALRALLAEATVDAYGDEEEFIGVLYTLKDRLAFPLAATALGQRLEVVGLDDQQSGLRRGILAQVRKGRQEYTIGLAELTFIDPDAESAGWLAMYTYWLST